MSDFLISRHAASLPAGECPEAESGSEAARLARHAGELGREAAELAATIDALAVADASQREALSEAAGAVAGWHAANRSIAQASDAGHVAVRQARVTLARLSLGVTEVVETLREVAHAAGEIRRIALQTRLAALNASIEARRADAADSGVEVVADAVGGLAARIEQSSKRIVGTIGQLEARLASLAREIVVDGSGDMAFQVDAALGRAESRVDEIAGAARRHHATGESALAGLRTLALRVDDTAGALEAAQRRAGAVLDVSAALLELSADGGSRTADTAYVDAAVATARAIAERFEQALQTGQITIDALFDDDYRPVPGSDPVQYLTRFTALADALLPELQEPVLGALADVVFCAAVDRNGYLPTHNAKYSRPQGADPVWNAANCRHRRIFADRTALAAARNLRRFLLQTGRCDLGDGRSEVLKDLSVPIMVRARHWGGLRIAYRF